MKIHHVTCEWDYTLGVEETGGYHYLTLSILRQPDQVPDRKVDGIRVLSWANVDMVRRGAWSGGDWGGVDEVWLRGKMSKRGVAASSRLRFITRRAANEQLIRVYNALRRYERELLR